MKKKIIAVICVLSLLWGCAGKPVPDDTGKGGDEPVSFSFNAQQPAGKRDTAVSLNGQWELFVDSRETTKEYQQDDGSGAVQVPLNEEIYAVDLTLPALSETDFVKAKAMILAVPGAVTADGAADLNLKIRINGGAWIDTDVSDYANGQTHWVNLKLRREDLRQGENRIEITSNASEGVWLKGNTKEDGSTVAYGIRIRTAACAEEWQEAVVPQAAEGQFEVSFADRVYPETYNGVVWYRKTFSFTEDMEKQNWWLCFDAVDYKADVWLNGAYLGGHEGGYTGFDFCLTGEDGALHSGENMLVVRVVDQDWNNGLSEDDIHIKETLAGFAQDTRGLNYCGIWQSVYLEPRGQVAIQDVYVQMKDYSAGEVEPRIRLYNPSDQPVELTVEVKVKETGDTASQKVTAAPLGTTEVKLALTVKEPECWSPDTPNLYTLAVTAGEKETGDCLEQSFGISKAWVEGNKIMHNGRAVFLTGMLHWGSYYENYTSAIAVERVEEEIRQLKKDGFNAIKYCLFSPPEYILDICDRLGIYVYIEYPIWNPQETEAFYERAYLQMMELVEKDRMHPCVIMSDFNCEDLEFSAAMDELMRWCVEQGKAADPDRLFTDNSSNGEHRYGEYATCHPYYQARAFEDKLERWIEARGDVPLILGEYADVSVLRDIEELNEKTTEQYSWYHDYFKDVDQAKIMRDAGYTEEQIDDIIAASVKNAQELKLYFVEASKAHENVAGLFLTHICESPNGWADGWLDDMYRPRFDSDRVRMSTQENALLLNQENVNYRAGKEQKFVPAVSLYGGNDVRDAVLKYVLTDAEGKTAASGTAADGIQLKNGNYYELPTFTVKLPESARAASYQLTLELTMQGELLTRNAWTIWAYPEKSLGDKGFSEKKVQVYDPSNRLKLQGRYDWMTGYTGGSGADLVVASQMDGTILNYVNGGGRVVYVGADSGVTQVAENWDYNRFSFAFFPDKEDSLAADLLTGGYGGLQFAELATPYHLLSQENGKNIIGRFGITDGSINSYLCEYQLGQGTMLMTTLRLDDSPLWLGDALLTHEALTVNGSQNILGAYLLEQMIRYELEK